MNKLYMFLITLTNFECHSAVRVCKTFPDFYDVILNKGCYDNPYSKWSQVEIVSSWGFTTEEYMVETEDGYLIHVIRGYKRITQRNPVLLAHGFVNSAYCWLGKANTSLTYLLGEAGFDVWLPNWRGTKQSRGHKILSDSQSKYWQFSFDEMGKYDMSAVLNKMNEITKQKAIFIGFSMGCNIGFIFNIEHPQMAEEKLERMIMIAPAMFFYDTRSSAQLVIPFVSILKKIPLLSYHGELFPFLPLRPLRYICDYTPGMIILCELFKSTLVGFNLEQLDVERVPVFNAINYDATSLGTGLQFVQYIKRKKFEAYDLGKKKNIIKYGTETPKTYNLSEVNVPVTVYAGTNDFFISVKSAQKVYDSLQTQYQCGFHVVSDRKFTHYSVTEAKDAQMVLYPSVINAAESGAASKCRV